MTLSQRIAALEGPDRAIDEKIARANGWRRVKEGYPIGTVWYDANGISHPWLPSITASIDAALLLVQPSMQAHVLHEAQKLLGPRGEIVGKFTQQLACAICEVALKERGL